MSRIQKFYLWMAVSLAIALGIAWHNDRPLASPPLRVGPETTFLTGPLDADGQVDYLAAIRQALPPVPDERNLLVQLARLAGPPCYSLNDGTEVPELAAHCPPFPDVGVLPRPPMDEQWVLTGSKQEVQAWVTASAPVTARACELLGDPALNVAPLFEPTAVEGTWITPLKARPLTPLAMLVVYKARDDLAAGRTEQGLEGLRRVRRLAGQLQHVQLVECQMAGAVIDQLVSRAVLHWLTSPAYRAGGEEALTALLERPVPELRRGELARCARYLILQRLIALQEYRNTTRPHPWKREDLGVAHGRLIHQPDINAVLTRFNTSYVELARLLEKGTPAETLAALQAHGKALAKGRRAPPSGLFGSAPEWADFFGSRVVSSGMLAITRLQQELLKQWCESEAQRRMVLTLVASTAYAQANGRPPKNLAELVPAYLPAAPLSPYTQEELALGGNETGKVQVSCWRVKTPHDAQSLLHAMGGRHQPGEEPLVSLSAQFIAPAARPEHPNRAAPAPR